MGYSDTELIARWQRGESAAFEEIVRRWQQPVARFLNQMTGRTDLVPDLSQEVFLRVFQAGSRYRDNGHFSTWLYRIALNVSQDAARRGRRLPQLFEGPEIADRGPTAEKQAEEKEFVELAARAVAELPEPLRLVLVLRHYEQLSFEEIARLTGTPASTLKSRFAVALQRLKTRLQELGWRPEENAS